MTFECKKQYIFDDFILYADGSFYYKNEQKHIPPKELGVLVMLLEAAGQVVKKESIIEKIWPEMVASDESLTRCIYTLRRILGETKDRKYVQTVYGRGYKFTIDVVAISPNQQHREQKVIAILPFKSPDKGESVCLHNELIQNLSKYSNHGIGILPAAITSECNSLLKLDELVSQIKPDFYLIGQMIKIAPKKFKLFVEYVQSKGHNLVYHESIEFNKRDSIEAITNRIWNIIKNNTPGLQWSIKNDNEVSSMETAVVYLNAKKNLHQYDIDSLNKAIKLFSYCINVNPYHSLPYCGIAEAYISQMFLGLKEQHETLPVVLNVLNKATKLEPGNPVALCQLAYIKSIMHENTLATILFKQAKLLAPDAQELNFYEAMYLLNKKEYASALNVINRCIEKDSFSIQYNVLKAWLLYLNKRGNEGIECIQRLLIKNKNQVLIMFKFVLELKCCNKEDVMAVINNTDVNDKNINLYKKIINGFNPKIENNNDNQNTEDHVFFLYHEKLETEDKKNCIIIDNCNLLLNKKMGINVCAW